MVNSGLEKLVDSLAGSDPDKEIPKVGGSEDDLEEVVRNHKPSSTLGNIMNIAVGLGSIAVSFAYAGPISILAGATAFLGDLIVTKRRGRDFTSRQFRNGMFGAAGYGYLGSMAFNWMNAAYDVTTWGGFAKRGVVQMFAYAPIMGFSYNTLNYPLENKTLKHLPEIAWKELWWKNYKATLKYFAGVELAVARFAPAWTHFPLAILGALLWRTTFGSRRVRVVDPYIYEHKKIQGKSVYELGRQYGVSPGQDRYKKKANVKPLYPEQPVQQQLPKVA